MTVLLWFALIASLAGNGYQLWRTIRVRAEKIVDHVKADLKG